MSENLKQHLTTFSEGFGGGIGGEPITPANIDEVTTSISRRLAPLEVAAARGGNTAAVAEYNRLLAELEGSHPGISDAVRAHVADTHPSLHSALTPAAAPVPPAPRVDATPPADTRTPAAPAETPAPRGPAPEARGSAPRTSLAPTAPGELFATPTTDRYGSVFATTGGENVPSRVFATGTEQAATLNQHWESIQTQSKEIKDFEAAIERKTKAGGATYAATTEAFQADADALKAMKDRLKLTGRHFEAEAVLHQDALNTHLADVKRAHMTAIGQRGLSEAEITRLTREHGKVVEKIAEDQRHLATFQEEAQKLAGHAKANPAVLQTAAAGGSMGADAAKEGKFFVHEEGARNLGVDAAEHAKKGRFGKAIQNLKANTFVSKIENGVVHKSGMLGQGMKIATSGVGVYLVGKSAVDGLSAMGATGPKVDAEGKEVESPSLVKPIVEFAGGAALLAYMARGGKSTAFLNSK